MRREWRKHNPSMEFLTIEITAATILIISRVDMMWCYDAVLEMMQTYSVYQVIYWVIGMRMRNASKLQSLYTEKLRRRFQFLLNRIRKLKNFTTFNFEHKRSWSTEVHNSNVLFHRYVAANYLVVSKNMKQEPCQQARGEMCCD